MLPKIYRIKEKRIEDESHFTLFFEGSIDYNPGQFVMLWLPRVDEKPFALSYHDKKGFGITIEIKGSYSKRLSKLESGDNLGIRGPFGHGFSLNSKRSCIVAGGTGIASVAVLIERLMQMGKNVSVIQGARSKGLLLYKERFKDVIFCTDDGSHGKEGFTTSIFEEKVKYQKYDKVYTCGPEVMMKSVVELCDKHDVDVEASLERYMRCGFGICGACVCGKERVCIEGPVFNSERLRNMPDFGKSAQLRTGKEVSLKEYFSWRSR